MEKIEVYQNAATPNGYGTSGASLTVVRNLAVNISGIRAMLESLKSETGGRRVKFFPYPRINH
jgi:hypothetical protein